MKDCPGEDALSSLSLPIGARGAGMAPESAAF